MQRYSFTISPLQSVVIKLSVDKETWFHSKIRYCMPWPWARVCLYSPWNWFVQQYPWIQTELCKTWINLSNTMQIYAGCRVIYQGPQHPPGRGWYLCLTSTIDIYMQPISRYLYELPSMPGNNLGQRGRRKGGGMWVCGEYSKEDTIKKIKQLCSMVKFGTIVLVTFTS